MLKIMQRLLLLPVCIPGEQTRMVPPVPIPNTAVKHPGPMVVLRGRE